MIENGYLPSTKHLEIYLKLLISCFNCPTYFRHTKIKSKKVWRKNLLRFGFYDKNSKGEVNVLPPPRNRVNWFLKSSVFYFLLLMT